MQFESCEASQFENGFLPVKQFKKSDSSGGFGMCPACACAVA